jgi:hypothetical protein
MFPEPAEYKKEGRIFNDFFKTATSNFFCGETHEGKRDGQGIYVIKDTGDIYEGYWNNDEKSGRGRFIWSDGENYDGEYCKSKRHGYGIYTYLSGNKYEG